MHGYVTTTILFKVLICKAKTNWFLFHCKIIFDSFCKDSKSFKMYRQQPANYKVKKTNELIFTHKMCIVKKLNKWQIENKCHFVPSSSTTPCENNKRIQLD